MDIARLNTLRPPEAPKMPATAPALEPLPPDLNMDEVDNAVNSAFYTAWTAPALDDVLSNQRAATLTISIDRSRHIIRSQMTSPSGSHALDSSILDAAARTRQIPSKLPSQFPKESYDLKTRFHPASMNRPFPSLLRLAACLFGLVCLPNMAANAQESTPEPAKASWWRRIPGMDFFSDAEAAEAAAKSKKPLPRLRLGAFWQHWQQCQIEPAGGVALLAGAFVLDSAPADFVLTGSSVGGRVEGLLKDAKGKQLFERSYAAPGLNENVKALADDVIFSSAGRPGLATSRIVFVSDRGGSKQIYITDASGSDVQQLTHERHGAVAPTLSPDGSMVAYTTYRSGFPSTRIIDIHSGFDRAISDTPGGVTERPFARGLAAFAGDEFIGNPEIFITDLNSDTAACVSDSIGAPGSPSWHPDGRRLALRTTMAVAPSFTSPESPRRRRGSTNWPAGAVAGAERRSRVVARWSADRLHRPQWWRVGRGGEKLPRRSCQARAGRWGDAPELEPEWALPLLHASW